MIEARDLFGNYRLVTEKKPLDERATLIAYFVEQFHREPKVLGIRLSHCSLSDLYAIKSMFDDRLKRNGQDAAEKWFWWSTRTHKVDAPVSSLR